MKITFLGVGEAFDENFANTSIFIEAGEESAAVRLLLDCGYSVPPSFWKMGLEPDALDLIWLSHFHADHTFGLPALLVRFFEENRKSKLTIAGQMGIKDFVYNCLELAYPGITARLTFPLDFKEIEPGTTLSFCGIQLRTAINGHIQRDLAIRIDSGHKSLYYSGDGRPTDEGIKLGKGVDIVVHEMFSLDKEIPGHGSLTSCIEFAKQTGAKSLAIVHVKRNVRENIELGSKLSEIKDLKVFLPQPHETITL